ncbi:MAG: hypothetical protein AAF970_04910 [Bacteroidota bacterium]
MNTNPCNRGLFASAWGPGLGLLLLLSSACATPNSPAPPATELDQEPPRLLNAFFGLDEALPERARLLCRAAPGRDGMPVTFSRRVTSMAPDDFVVITQSGARKTPLCATLRPANEASEGHTVLLIGDLGSAQDPPARVDVVGDLLLEADGHARGLTVDVTPLEAGPTLVLAIAYAAGMIGSDCPQATRQIVQVTWAGGVQPAQGAAPDAHRTMYRVLTDSSTVIPTALGDLHDNDNYVHLCLTTPIPASEVRAQAGVLVDPRGDLNPFTSVAVSR